jgi:hypothetical protein
VPDANNITGTWDKLAVDGESCIGSLPDTYELEGIDEDTFEISVDVEIGGTPQTITASCELTGTLWVCDTVTKGLAPLCVATVDLDGTWDGADLIGATLHSTTVGTLCGACDETLEAAMTRAE